MKVSGGIADCETRRGPERTWDCIVYKWTTQFLIDEASTDMTAQIATGPVERNDRGRSVKWRIKWRVDWKIPRHRGCCDQRRNCNSCNQEFFHDPPPHSPRALAQATEEIHSM